MANDPGKPDFSNVKSGSASTAAPAAPKPDFSNVASGVESTAPTVPDSTLQTYTVAKGDTLSKIAKKFYGNANQWRVIFEANNDRISNPDLIRIGQVLKIPPAKA
ncbi:MAG: LysM peptidoglycan-binding domain-containing protein [Dokdonella sp.]|uniref:LysM peptidoglycan-binding domain-containing protein n=1 Tax=Dokdonella sp. TaxID=2291710 RepID=UPI002C29AA83|nr:LysM peptidoglycan-binding domain-containing protein [Dokdonella sp.]HOX71690.1 LysM peptidoglycan-binding domain-containing protein [Dokdonella sp.]HPG93798.1 LysM peptidoglycan-binding domain-containing protein [Dokdonella sp.]HPN80221.1 LysM peptidoglycan-binding domain-containing protein [Dokdonella sp.]